MNGKANQNEIKAESFDCGNDFMVLSCNEKRKVLKNARDYLKLLNDNALLADSPVVVEAKNEG